MKERRIIHCPPCRVGTHDICGMESISLLLRKSAFRQGGWAAPTYTDVYNLRKATFPDGAGTGRQLWLQWQKDPGVVAYFPTYDANGPLVQPSPDWDRYYNGRTPDKFWPGDYQAWETRQLPRLASYIQKQQDHISAFWSHQWITDISMHSGALAIPAADGKVGTAYMARMPIVTKDNGPINSIIQIATDLREPGTHATPYERAKDWLTIYWWVDPDTGQNWSHGYGGRWGKKGLLRKASGSRGWFGPYDMPWRLTQSQFYTTMLERDGYMSANLLRGGGYYYKAKRIGGKDEYEFYPGAKELITYDPSLPTGYFNMYFPHLSGLGAYLENLLPLRFVRRN